MKKRLKKRQKRRKQKREIVKKNKGQLIVDAICTPADIRYPTDISLLNEARENAESLGLLCKLCFLNSSIKYTVPVVPYIES